MNRNYWLDRATEKIRFQPDRRRVRRELEDHILDRMEASPLTGYEAEQAAVAAMGDPEALAVELGRIHTPYLGWLWRGSQWLLVLLVIWFLLGGVAPDLGETFRIYPSDEWSHYMEDYMAVGEQRVLNTDNPDGTSYQVTITCEALWKDLDLGELGGYHWSVPVAYGRSWTYSGAVPEESEGDSSSMEVGLTAETWKIWKLWAGRDSIRSVTDNLGNRYPNDVLRYDPSGSDRQYFWGNTHRRTPFSTSVILHMEGVKDLEQVEWLDVEIGDQVLRIDLRGGERQ